MSVRILLGLCIALVACADERVDAGPSIAVDVAALELPGVHDAIWDLRVATNTNATITTVRLSASRYGDGIASASYVAPCDPSTNDNRVELRLIGIYPATVASPGSFGAAAPAGALPVVDPGLMNRAATCAPNADTLVRFDVTLMRPASQGFFDVAVQLEDVFCSAKYDCGGAALLFGENDQRIPTHVLGLACTAGAGASATRMHLSDVTLDCGAAGTAVIDPSRGPGNLCTAGATETCAPAVTDPQGLLVQAASYRGLEAQGNIAYWNVALAAGSTSGCSVSARATVDDGSLFSGAPIAIGADLTYPYVRWNVDLATCPTSAALSSSGPVQTVYAQPGGAAVSFAHSFTAGSPPAPPPPSHTDALVFYLDAGNATSYPGSGQLWKNLVSAPADGSPQARYDFQLGTSSGTDMRDAGFQGTAGGQSPSEYFRFDGNDLFRIAGGNTGFINSLHKDGAKYTVILWVQMGPSMSNFGNLFGTLGWQSGNPGMIYSFRNGPQHLLYVGNYGTTIRDARGAIATAGTAYMMAVSIDEPGDVGYLYLNGAYDKVNGADTFSASYLSPPTTDSACALELGNAGCAVGDNYLANGTRIYGVRVFNKALSKAEMDAEWTLARTRMGL